MAYQLSICLSDACNSAACLSASETDYDACEQAALTEACASEYNATSPCAADDNDGGVLDTGECSTISGVIYTICGNGQ
jgi:hypothetical protein